MMTEHEKTPPKGEPTKPVWWAIGEKFDEHGRPLFETSGPVSVALDAAERFFEMYRRAEPRGQISSHRLALRQIAAQVIVSAEHEALSRGQTRRQLLQVPAECD